MAEIKHLLLNYIIFNVQPLHNFFGVCLVSAVSTVQHLWKTFGTRILCLTVCFTEFLFSFAVEGLLQSLKSHIPVLVNVSNCTFLYLLANTTVKSKTYFLYSVFISFDLFCFEPLTQFY
jgi:hypothetical protein